MISLHEFYRDYRVATCSDYQLMVRLLDGNQELDVLVRSLLRSDESPYSLLRVSQGPYRLSKDGMEGFDSRGKFCVLRIVGPTVHFVEIKKDNGDWFAPEMGSITLHIRQDALRSLVQIPPCLLLR